jgi:hypothetical protein
MTPEFLGLVRKVTIIWVASRRDDKFHPKERKYRIAPAGRRIQ